MIYALNVNQWINLSINVVLLVLLVFLVIRIVKNQADIPYIIASVFCASFGNIFYFVMNIYDSFFAIIGVSSTYFSFLFLYMHYIYLSNDRLNIGIYSLITSFIVYTLILAVQLISYSGQFSSDQISYSLDWMYIIGSTASLIAICLSFWMILQNYRNTKNRQVFIEFIGIIFLTFYRIIFFIRDISVIQDQIFSIIGLVFAFLGLTIIILNYIRNPKYLYSIPFPIHSFMIYDHAGLLMYSKHFKFEEASADVNRDILITSAFTALNSLIKHNLGIGGELNRIEATGFSIYFVNLPDNAGRLGVISEGRTKFFTQSLKRFVSSFPDEIIQSFIKTHKFPDRKQIDDLIQNAFPYVDFAK
ncbi:hypothetical protein NEF87_003388 [Candidatus Lokiarchaeum ossiferum]|uniref:Histidine kinase N-terminal 7TM region domain-containing protein n=1 Tax=Candidatus Lokiarchaeum ossiferum TaxID=2951803 RepID=A0ABY6HUS8_9ARCH|nr:hypothetical protein NEF87_003388 [Candidatus Lokiarchaeum sp. B-35]